MQWSRRPERRTQCRRLSRVAGRQRSECGRRRSWCRSSLVSGGSPGASACRRNGGTCHTWLSSLFQMCSAAPVVSGQHACVRLCRLAPCPRLCA
eukprot:6173123-Pleurochrysis_carterae.AAC.1